MYYEAILWFAVTFTVMWIILFALNPNFVRVVECDDIYPRPGAPPDPVKCMIFAVVFGLLIAIVRMLTYRNPDCAVGTEFLVLKDSGVAQIDDTS